MNFPDSRPPSGEQAQRARVYANGADLGHAIRRQRRRSFSFAHVGLRPPRVNSPSDPPPRRNIECKATDPDPSASLAVCRALSAQGHGDIRQRDTYFAVAHGGLKLREETPGRPHLIQFERANEPEQRESRYRIVEINDPEALRLALTAAIGTTVVVCKTRRLFLWRQVRIHLDTVQSLGSFIELEAVATPDSDLSQEHALVQTLRERLQITDERLIASGYAEQLRSLRAHG
jgi:adenylate cyclase class IV